MASPQYQSLPPDQQAAAQEQYFNEVVAPQAGESAGQAKQAFFSAYPLATQSQQQSPNQQDPSFLQQAGNAIEQAGRGLVNIPFDALQGGASLINAVSQGVGGPKLLDDVYRPVDRPTDPYAQAGEAIGNYLTPGLGVAGNMVAGSLAEAGNQQGDFAENAAKNAAVNLGAQGVLSGAAKAVGRGITALRGQVNPEVAQRIAGAEAAGVTPMTSDVLPQSGAFAKGLVQGGEGALLGTGAARAAQQDARQGIIQSYQSKFGEYAPEAVIDSMALTILPNLHHVLRLYRKFLYFMLFKLLRQQARNLAEQRHQQHAGCWATESVYGENVLANLVAYGLHDKHSFMAVEPATVH